MAKLFISYSRSDEAFARQIAERLSEWGADVWIDVEDIPAGANWSNSIDEGLRLCELMILIITPESMRSRNVEDEWQSYHGHKPIVPLLLRNASVHYQLKRLQYINFAEQPFDQAAKQLYGELTRNGASLNPIPASDASQSLPAQQSLQGSRPPAQRRGWLSLAATISVIAVVAAFVLPRLNSAPTPTQESVTQPTASGQATPLPDPILLVAQTQT